MFHTKGFFILISSVSKNKNDIFASSYPINSFLYDYEKQRGVTDYLVRIKGGSSIRCF